MPLVMMTVVQTTLDWAHRSSSLLIRGAEVIVNNGQFLNLGVIVPDCRTLSTWSHEYMSKGCWAVPASRPLHVAREPSISGHQHRLRQLELQIQSPRALWAKKAFEPRDNDNS